MTVEQTLGWREQEIPLIPYVETIREPLQTGIYVEEYPIKELINFARARGYGVAEVYDPEGRPFRDRLLREFTMFKWAGLVNRIGSGDYTLYSMDYHAATGKDAWGNLSTVVVAALVTKSFARHAKPSEFVLVDNSQPTEGFAKRFVRKSDDLLNDTGAPLTEDTEFRLERLNGLDYHPLLTRWKPRVWRRVDGWALPLTAKPGLQLANPIGPQIPEGYQWIGKEILIEEFRPVEAGKYDIDVVEDSPQ